MLGIWALEPRSARASELLPVALGDVGLIVESLSRPLAAALDVSAADAAAFDQLGPIGSRDIYVASLASGNAGLALACGFLDKAYPEAGWGKSAHTYLQRAVQACPERMPGLFDGLAGLGFVADYLSRGRGRYQRFLADLEASLESGVDRLCAVLDQARTGCHFPVFDLVSGLAGIAIFLSRRGQGVDAVVVLDNAHRLTTDDLRRLVETAEAVRFVCLAQPGSRVAEVEARFALQKEVLSG